MNLDAFKPLTAAEQAVIAGLGTGHVTVLGDGTLPGESAGEDRQVRASLIRWLALGAPGDDNLHLHEKGLRIAGALVVSDGEPDLFLKQESTPGLDLQGCTLAHDLALFACHFLHAPLLRAARVQSLFLNGAALPGLIADGLEAQGGVFLRAVHATGEVRLVGARVGGDLSCTGGRFENAGGKAICADRLEVRGGVFLRDVHVTGEVRLNGAQVGGNLDCAGGRFENAGGRALNVSSARVTGALFWRDGSHALGLIDLMAAEIGNICDDIACWPAPGDLLLDRCRYGAFTGKGISGAERIRWLDLQKPEKYGHDFWPQPWEQCAKVLREMGHAEDARQVLIAKEERQRRVKRERLRRERQGTWRHALDPLTAFGDGLLGALIAYGHRPLRAVWWLVGFWTLGAVLFGVAYGDGGFKPNNAFILSKDEWAQCEAGGDLRGDHPSTLDCYRAQPEAAGYPAFNALLYSLDTLVPVVDLEVQEYWVPDETAAGWARWYLWAHIATGWFLALLAVAGFSGLVQTRATEE